MFFLNKNLNFFENPEGGKLAEECVSDIIIS